jgi:hypothetical protein
VGYDPRLYGLQGLLQPRPARLALATGAGAEGDQAPLDSAAATLAVADLRLARSKARGFADSWTRKDGNSRPAEALLYRCVWPP